MPVIVREKGRLSCNIGRLTVAYLPDPGVVRVVLSSTGEVIREDEAGEMSLAEFKEVVNKYRKLSAL